MVPIWLKLSFDGETGRVDAAVATVLCVESKDLESLSFDLWKLILALEFARGVASENELQSHSVVL